MPLIRSRLHSFFYLISAAKYGGGGGEGERRKERREGGFSRCGGRLLRGLPHKLDCRSVQMYVAINPAGKNNGDSFCKWRKT